MIKVSLISLGCAKNLVDSEIMVGHLHQAGMMVIPEAEKADVVIVNTCSFIDSSKEESLSHILEVHQSRGMTKRRQEQKLISINLEERKQQKAMDDNFRKEMKAEKERLAKDEFPFKPFYLGPPPAKKIKAPKNARIVPV